MAMNLVQHRCGPSVWERAEVQQAFDVERWLLASAAGVILVSGLRQRSAAGLLLVLGGGALAWWAAAGADERNRRRGQLRAVVRRQRPSDTIGAVTVTLRAEGTSKSMLSPLLGALYDSW